MKLTFLGTRGYIDARNRRHKRHTITQISYRGKNVLVDCGEDWLGKVESLNPDAIVITHGHPDHVWGLKEGSPCKIYATKESWNIIENYPIEKKKRIIVKPRKPFTVYGITFEVFPVVHSIIAPGVGYRIFAGNVCIFCVHDLISIKGRKAALSYVQLYVGDGASITRPIIRRKDNQLFGHTSIKNQLVWCKKEGVPRAIFTHCGSEIVEGDERVLKAKVRRLGKEQGVEASIAYDGKEIFLR